MKALGAGDSNGSTTSEDEESDDDTTEEVLICFIHTYCWIDPPKLDFDNHPFGAPLLQPSGTAAGVAAFV